MQNFQLLPDSSGNVAVAGTDTSNIQKIGPIPSDVIEHIQEPKDGVTRLIVTSLRGSASAVVNIFDINYSGELTIIGNGHYKFSKKESSNIWNLEINADDIQKFSVYEGVAPNTVNPENHMLTIKPKTDKKNIARVHHKRKPKTFVTAVYFSKDSNNTITPNKTLPNYDVPTVSSIVSNNNYINYYPGAGGVLFWTNCKGCNWQVSTDGVNYIQLLGAFDLMPLHIYRTTPFYQFNAGKLVSLSIRNKDGNVYGKWTFIIQNGKTIACEIMKKAP